MTVADNALRYLSSDQVMELCRSVDPVESIIDAFRAVRSGSAAITPEAGLRWTAPDGAAARSLILPAWHNDSYGCKIINASLGNVARGIPRAHGLIVLFSPETAMPVCLMEGGYISALRTAAVSMVALGAVRDPDDVRTVAFLGCGRQASTHLDLMAPRTAVRTVTAFDHDAGRAEQFAAQVLGRMPHLTVTPVATAEAAMRHADVTIAATTTATAYVAADWLRTGGVFLNVSLDDATEDLLMDCDHLIVDDWGLVSEDNNRLLGRLAAAGRATGPGESAPPGGRSVDAELATVLAGAYPRSIDANDRVVINPFGMGVHDIAIAARVHAAAQQQGIGTHLPR